MGLCLCQAQVDPKGKVPPGVPFGGAGHLAVRGPILYTHEAKLWHYAAKLSTLSVTCPLRGSALTDTTDNLSEMCPFKLTDFCLFMYH